MSCLCENISGGISLTCDNNNGGLKEFWVSEKCNVLTIGLGSPDDSINSITMVPGTYFHKYEFTKKSGSNYTEETTTGDNGGDTTIQTVTLKLNRREKTKRDALILLGRSKDLYIITKDSNGLNVLLGELNGMNRTTQTGGSGENKQADNGYTITFVGEEEQEANYVSNAALAAVQAP